MLQPRLTRDLEDMGLLDEAVVAQIKRGGAFEFMHDQLMSLPTSHTTIRSSSPASVSVLAGSNVGRMHPIRTPQSVIQQRGSVDGVTRRPGPAAGSWHAAPPRAAPKA